MFTIFGYKIDVKHLATVVLAPTLAALANAFTQSGNSFDPVALAADEKVAAAAFLAAVIALIVPSPVKATGAVLLLVGLSLGTSGCSAAQNKVYTDGAGAICQVVVAALDPSLAPLCTSAQALAEAVEMFLGDGGIGARAMVIQGSAGVVVATPVYQYLLAHGAKPVVR
jgi:hypothetical protein